MRRTEEVRIHGNLISRSINENHEILSYLSISQSWKDNYIEKLSRDDEPGLRPPQFGALSAIRSHWTVSDSAATIVLPTGVGKTETMLATILSERISSTLIIAPTKLLRNQIYKKAKSFGLLSNIGVLGDNALFPNTVCFQKGVNNFLDGWEIFNEANIIVSTVPLINGLSESIKRNLIKKIDVVIVDEAHHLGADGWAKLKILFGDKKILQFTATPFRNDGKQIGGKIIYNYGLGLAQDADYFRPIEFFPIEEFNEMQGDKNIAEKAIELLQQDLDEGLDHVLLARAKTKERAEDLFNNIYSQYKGYSPVLIHSGLKISEQRERLEKIQKGVAKIVVGVDMFGEGIDFPTLKIAAIHDKYKTLPITLQFIGRFTRDAQNVGTAKLVTNIANDDLKEVIADLYKQDANWNSMLRLASESQIDSEINYTDFINDFSNIDHSEVDLAQLKLRISARIFKTKSTKMNIIGWSKILDPDMTFHYFNEESNILVLIEKVKKEVDWSKQKDIYQYDWDCFIIYYDHNRDLIYINETNEGKGNRLIEVLFGKVEKIGGDNVYRVLNGINRLMIGTMGLKKSNSGHISFQMFAGTDVKQGISQAVREGTIKSNLFGYGYKNGEKISIGCSYKGKIWMRWVENLDFLKNWCNEVGEKLLDGSINTSDVLENTLVVEQIQDFPDGVPYKIRLADDIVLSSADTKTIHFPIEDKYFPFYCLDICEPRKIDGKILFDVLVNERKAIFSIQISEGSYKIIQEDGSKIQIRKHNTTESLEDFLEQNTPVISFIDDKGIIYELEGNLLVDGSKRTMTTFPIERIESIDWNAMGVDIKVEAQKQSKITNSIQYATINNIVPSSAKIVFDDDGSGEIADIVAIESIEASREIHIHLYHCKYSKEDKPGSRVGDLYEVCGQAEKSVVWNSSISDIFKRIQKREILRLNKKQVSRFEVGTLETLKMIENQYKRGYSTKLHIYIVQPGVSKNKITKEMHRILNAMETYLMETYEVKAICYFSE